MSIEVDCFASPDAQSLAAALAVTAATDKRDEKNLRKGSGDCLVNSHSSRDLAWGDAG